MLHLLDAFQCTVLHAAVQGGNLHHIPPNLVTRESLAITDYLGDTVLQAAFESWINQLDSSLLTPDLLFLENDKGITVIECALIYGDINYIPVTPELASKFLQLKALIGPLVLDETISSEIRKKREILSHRWLSKVAKLWLRLAPREKPS